MTDDPKPEYLVVKEAALLLRCSPSSVYKLVESGQLPAFRLNGGERPGIRIHRRDLEPRS